MKSTTQQTLSETSQVSKIPTTLCHDHKVLKLRLNRRRRCRSYTTATSRDDVLISHIFKYTKK